MYNFPITDQPLYNQDIILLLLGSKEIVVCTERVKAYVIQTTTLYFSQNKVAFNARSFS